MLVYIIGMSELTNGKPVSDPYYFAYTTNQQVANQYYNTLIERFENDSGSCTDPYDNFYFIQKVSKSKFDVYHADKNSPLYGIPELEEYADGVYLTENDYEFYCESLMDAFDQINHAISNMGDFIHGIKTCAKYSKNKRLKEDVKLFRAAFKAIKADFSNFDEYLEKIDLNKLKRTNSF